VDRRSWVILLVLMIAEITSAFELMMVYAGLKSWIEQFGNPATVGWLVTSYLLVAAGAALVGGRLGDIYGRRTVLLTTLFGCAAGSIVSATSADLNIMIVGRAIQGMSGAIVPLCYGLAREYLPQKFVPFAISCIVAVASIASALGLIIGGALTDQFGPHSIFYASAITAVASIVCVFAGLPRVAEKLTRAPLDPLGVLLFAPSIGAILFAVGELEGNGISNPVLLWTFVLGIVGLAVWVRHELRHPYPLIELRLLGKPGLALPILVMCFVALGGLQLTQIISLLIQQPSESGAGLGLSAAVTGTLKLPALLAGSIAALGTSWLATKFGVRAALLLGATFTGLGVLPCLLGPITLASVVAFMIITSIGVAIAYSAASNGIVKGAPSDRTSEATGMMIVARSVAHAVGAQVTMVLIGTSFATVGGTRYPDATAYNKAFLWVALTPALACLLIVLWRRSGASDAMAEAPAEHATASRPL
jgi:MFS family permease